MALRLPTAAAKGLLEITPSFLRTLGVKAILLDVDNTLSHHGSQTPFDGSIEWVRQMEQEGFSLIIVSNNTKERITPFAAQFGLPFIGEPASRFPSGIKRLPSSWGYGAAKL